MICSEIIRICNLGRLVFKANNSEPRATNASILKSDTPILPLCKKGEDEIPDTFPFVWS